MSSKFSKRLISAPVSDDPRHSKPYMMASSTESDNILPRPYTPELPARILHIFYIPVLVRCRGMEKTSHLVEPITELTNCMFEVFDPAADEDILVPLGLVDGDTTGMNKVRMRPIKKCKDDGRCGSADELLRRWPWCTLVQGCCDALLNRNVMSAVVHTDRFAKWLHNKYNVITWWSEGVKKQRREFPTGKRNSLQYYRPSVTPWFHFSMVAVSEYRCAAWRLQ